ncbi:hypothetical protein TRIP_B50392 [uncultured Desulfatiglans sp.]|nr:hypothetical protein TRIP_B50392 [uncultured Desulfatiglans sp.]
MKVSLNNPGLNIQTTTHADRSDKTAEQAVFKNYPVQQISKKTSNNILADILAKIKLEAHNHIFEEAMRFEYVRYTYSRAVYHKHIKS